MSKSENRWIVLVNKRPRGPLSADEIRMLLEKKLIGRNDLAFLVPAEGKGKPTQSDWKLLWQYPEFDRRLDPKSALEQPTATNDRREPTAEALAKKKIEEALPPELTNLAIEDLIPKSTGPTQVELQDVESLPEGELPATNEESSFFRKPTFVLGGGFSLIFLAVWLFSRGTADPDARPLGARSPLTPSDPHTPPVPTKKATPRSLSNTKQPTASTPKYREPGPSDSDSPPTTPTREPNKDKDRDRDRDREKEKDRDRDRDKDRDRDRGYISEDSRDSRRDEDDDSSEDEIKARDEDEEDRGRSRKRKPARSKRVQENEEPEDQPSRDDEDDPDSDSRGRD